MVVVLRSLFVLLLSCALSSSVWARGVSEADTWDGLAKSLQVPSKEVPTRAAAVEKGELLRSFFLKASRFRRGDPRLDRSVRILQVQHPFLGQGLDTANLYYRKLRHEIEEVAGPDHPLVYQLFLAEADVLMNQGEPLRARNLLESLTDRAASSLGRRHPETMNANLRLVIATAAAGRLAAADTLVRQTLEDARQAFGPSHPMVAAALEAKAKVSIAMGDRSAALDARQQSVGIMEEQRGPLAAGLPGALVLLAESQQMAGSYRGAQKNLERALLSVESNEQTQAVVPELLARLARVRFSLADNEGARIDAKRALELSDQGAHSLPVVWAAQSMLVIAEVAIKEKEWGEVERRANQLGALKLPPGDASAGIQVEALRLKGRAQVGQGKGVMALANWTRARSIVVKTWGQESLQLGGLLNSRAWAQFELGEIDQGRETISEALVILRKLEKHPRITTAAALDTLASLEQKAGNLGAARLAAEESIQIFESSQAAAGLESAYDTYASILEAKGDSAAAEEARAKAKRAGEARSPRLFVSKDLNFSFERPRGNWLPYDTKTINPRSLVSFARARPETIVMVMAEEGRSSLGELADFRERQLGTNGATRLKRQAREALELGGVPGLLSVVDARVDGRDLTYAYWYGSHGGRIYELIQFGVQGRPVEDTLRSAEASFEGFGLLDPSQVAATAAPEGPYESPRFGYSLELTGTEWTPWPEVRSTVPLADLGAVHPDGSILLVLPVVLPEPVKKSRKLIAGLWSLGSAGVPANPKHADRDGLRGRSTDSADGDVKRRFLALAGKASGLLAIVAATSKNPKTVEARFNILDAVQLDAAFDLNPPELEEFERERLATVLVGMGEWDDRRDRPAALVGAYQQAVALLPERLDLRELLMGAQLQAGKYEEVLKALEGFGDRQDEYPLSTAFGAWALEGLGRNNEALDTYVRAIEAGLDRQDVWTAFANLAIYEGRAEMALTLIDAADAEGLEISLVRVRLLRGSDQLDLALEIVERLVEENPGDVDVLSEVVQTLQTAGRHLEALEQLPALLEDKDGQAQGYYLKAVSEIELAQYREARASLEAALVLEPGSETLKAALDQVTGLIGEGQTALIRSPIEPISVPLVDEPVAIPKGAQDFGVYYEWRVRAVEQEESRPKRTTDRFRLRILDQNGAEKFSSLQFSFNPLTERIFVNELRVLDENGDEISKGDVGTYYVLDSPDDTAASSQRTLHVPVHGVRPGATVLMTVTRQETGGVLRWSFEKYLFSSSIPVARAEYHLVGITNVKVHPSEGVQRAKTEGALRFWIEEPQPYRYEPLQGEASGFLPHVVLSDARDEWRSLALSYLEDLEPRLVLDTSLQDVVKSRLAGVEGRTRRVAELWSHVRDLLTYQAIEFGRRARDPKPVAETVQTRLGDCKDHSLLLYQLLRHAGFNAHLALVSFESEVDPGFPSLDQFDHMIVRCDDCGPYRWLDATGKNGDLGEGVPLYLAARNALVLDPEGASLQRIPDYGDERHQAQIDRTAAVQSDGSVLIDESLEFRGYPAAMLRGQLKRSERAVWPQILQQWYLPGANGLSVVKVDGLKDSLEPVSIAVRYSVRRQFSPSGDLLIGHLPALWEATLMEPNPVESRLTPFQLEFPLVMTSRVRVTSPSGYQLQKAPAASEEEGEFSAWRSSPSAKKEGFQLETRIRRHQGKFSADEYGSYVDEIRGALGHLRPTLQFNQQP